jgi:large subunit ribosomal protein L10
MVKAASVATVASIAEQFRTSQAAVVTEYRGLTMKQLTALRRALGPTTEYAVAKNTFAKRAAADAGVTGLDDLLTGPTGIAFVKGEPSEAAKAIREFAKTNPLLVIKGGVLDGRALPASDVAKLADLESREVLLAKFAGALKGNLAKAAGMLTQLPAQFARLAAALAEQKAAGAPAEQPAPAEEAAESAAAAAPAAAAAADAVSTESAAAEAPATDAASAEAPAGAVVADEAPIAEAPAAETPAAAEAPEAESAEAPAVESAAAEAPAVETPAADAAPAVTAAPAVDAATDEAPAAEAATAEAAPAEAATAEAATTEAPADTTATDSASEPAADTTPTSDDGVVNTEVQQAAAAADEAPADQA